MSCFAWRGSENSRRLRASSLLLFFVQLLFTGACHLQTGKSHYLLAERLFNDRKYDAAVQEFRRVIDSDPKSKVSQQALFREAQIEALYLGRFQEALQNFRRYTFLSQDSATVLEAEKMIGEILYSKIEDFPRASEQYKRLLGKYPDSLEKDFFYFRLGASAYGALDFKGAVKWYRLLIAEFPKSSLLEEAYFQIGNALYTDGGYEAAIDAYEDVLKRFSKGARGPFAEFGIAGCYEELEQLDEALQIYERLKGRYPNPAVLELKLRKVRDRKLKRNR